MNENGGSINDIGSNKNGFAGLMENVLRKFQTVGFLLFVLPIAALYMFCIGCAALPGVALWLWLVPEAGQSSLWLQACAGAASIGIGFFAAIVVLVVVVPVVNYPFRLLVKPYRGPWFSLESVAWYYHNALFYLVRYTVLDLIIPSPLSQYFFKAMGVKMGKGTMINTSNISDPCLIELGDYVTIGGSAFLMAHYAQKGFVVIEPLVIGNKTTVGLQAIIMGGVTIGDKVAIAPGATVLPKTQIADETKYGYEGLK